MHDAELNRLLTQARVPARPDEYWEDFPQAVVRTLSLQRAESPRANSPPRKLSRLKVAAWITAATACLAVGFFFGLRQGERNREELSVAEARRLFSEISSLFPNQVQAVVIEEAASELVLSKAPDVGRGAPVLLRLCGPRGCRSVITRSGQRLRIAGQPSDVLVDARGNVIVAGETFIWSNRSPEQSRPGGLRIEAKPLGEIL